jgi:signal transduction histidine kinase
VPFQLARFARFFRSTPARLTIGFVSLFLVGTLLVFVYLSFQIKAALVAQIDKSLLDQQSLLTVQFRDGGTQALFRAIESELLSRGKRERNYRILGRDGKVVFEAGELTLPEMKPFKGARDIEIPATESGPAARARAVSFAVGNRYAVYLAHSTKSIEETMQGFWMALLRAELLILLVGLGVGFWLGRRFWSQIESFNQMAMKIVNAANLSSRMPVKGDDEFAALATNMNAMLDRIEKLFQGIRQVSDNIAHDLRSPLTRLRADVEVALQQKDPERYQETLERVLEELQKMQEIFQSLLSLGQAEAGSLKIRKKPLDLSELLEDIVDLYGPLMEEKEQTLTTRIPEAVSISGDRQLLAQAFSNLLDNAIKYVPAGGIVELAMAKKGDKVEITLHDSGPGIVPEMRKKVFDRFVRVDPSRTLPGTGLGLSLVKAFIELHGGTISLADSKLGGAAFTIILPVY